MRQSAFAHTHRRHLLPSFVLLASAASRSRCTLLIGLYHSLTSGLFRFAQCSAFVQNQNHFADVLPVFFLSVFMAIKSNLIMNTIKKRRKKKLSRRKKERKTKTFHTFHFAVTLTLFGFTLISYQFIDIYCKFLYAQAGRQSREWVQASKLSYR